MGHPVVEISYCTLEEQIRTFEHFFCFILQKVRINPAEVANVKTTNCSRFH